MKELMVIEINDEGCFEKSPETIMYVPFNKTILFTFIGKRYPFFTPMLLSNYSNKEGKKYQISEEEKSSITLSQIYTDFNFFEGNYEINLNWSCRIHFDHSGLYFFQIIFVEKKFNEEDSQRKIIIPNHFEYLIVNPTNSIFLWPRGSQMYSANPSFLSLDESMRLGSGDFEITEKGSYFEDKKSQSLFIIPDSDEKIDSLKTEFTKMDFGSTLNFDSMSIVSLFPTMMGKIENWESELEYLIDRGFKGFHFSPIQELGKSHSLYAIRDFLSFNETIFGKNSSIEKLSHIFRNLKLKHNVFFLTDMIWNHCSVDCSWILEEPDCYFSPKNTPSLTVTLELDQSLQDFSSKFESLGLTLDNFIDSVGDLSKIIEYIRVSLLSPKKYEEYFQIDVKETMSEFQNYFEKKEGRQLSEVLRNGTSEFVLVDLNDLNTIKANLFDFGVKRFGVRLNHRWMVDFLEDFSKKNITFFEFKKILEQINSQFYQKTQEWIAEILENVSTEISARFLSKNVKIVTKEYPLVDSYFYKLSNGDFCLLNGSMHGIDMSKNPSLLNEHFYFRRKVIVWTDSIKLNYVSSKLQPKMWGEMTEYTKQMALVFDGFRLNNFQSTSIDIAKFFIDSAMKFNESLFLFSELFLNSPKIEANYCLKVGVHRLVHNLQKFTCMSDFLDCIFDNINRGTHFATQIPPLCENNYEITYLKPSKPMPIFFDQTYENKTYFQTHNIYVQLGILSIENFVSFMVGTTRGFDELFMFAFSSNSCRKYPSILSKEQDLSETANEILFFVKQENFG